MRRSLIPGLAILAMAGSCMNPRTQAYIAQSLTDVSTELNAQRQDIALLQEQIDSLKQVAAHQDSIIKKILNVTGVPPGLGTGNVERQRDEEGAAAEGRRFVNGERGTATTAQDQERRLRRGQP